MKVFIVCLLFGMSLGMITPLLFAQHDQNLKKSDSEVEGLKRRISELENQLQTVENVEKMELAAKLTDANAKLTNAEFGKFKNELRESNNEWLKSWSLWFLTIIGIFVAILIGVSYVFWYWLSMQANQLIADKVGESLNEFKEALAQQEVIKNQLEVLEKEHTVSVLENSPEYYLRDESLHTEQINALQEEVLLRVFGDETRLLEIRCNAAEVLAARKSPLLVLPLLEFLNSAVDSDSDWIASFDIQRLPHRLVGFLGCIHTLVVAQC